MFKSAELHCIRQEYLTYDDFYRDNLQIISQIGTYENHNKQMILFPVKQDSYFVLFIHEGSAFLYYENEKISIKKNMTIIIKMKQAFRIEFHNCMFDYAILEGKNAFSFLKNDNIVLESYFHKKTEIFFCSAYASLDKYEIKDDLSLSSSVLKFYSDVNHCIDDHQHLSSKDTMVKQALGYIETNYMHDISLKNIANHVGYSEYYFTRVFKEVVGMSPHEYIVRRRLTQAKVLLKDNTYTIEEIAHMCGFKNDIAFYKTFKKIYSVTPGDYKKYI